MAAPSKRGTGEAAIFSHFNSGAGKSAKVADKTLPDASSFYKIYPNWPSIFQIKKHSKTVQHLDLSSSTT